MIQDLPMILLTVLALAAVAFLFGLLLAFAAKKFAVKTDPRIDQVVACLSGANCGGCGFSGCAAYARAIVEEGAPANRCAAAGADGAREIARIMGVEAGETVRIRAQVRCTGSSENAKEKYTYVGLRDCRSVVRLGNGAKECAFGCIGLGSCETACAFGAIETENGVARVNPDRCRGCGACVSACPQNLIELVPFEAPFFVGCSSKEKGVAVRSQCDIGCIGCGICAKNCPVGAITVSDFLAKIDSERCTGCGTCAEKCPRKIILPGIAKSVEPAEAGESSEGAAE